MAGLSLRGTAIHASAEHARPRAARPALVEATVSLMGRAFRTTIHEGASAEQLIEKVANENGGYVTKKFYPEFNTSEIIAVKIGNEMLVKSSEAGIHFSLGESGIPIALAPGRSGTEGGASDITDIIFPNAEELKVGRATKNIALWMTSANFDPGSISDLDGMYSAKGGVKLSRAALDEVSKAHGGVRSEKLMLEENILVLNKDTGQVLTAQEHAAMRPQETPPQTAHAESTVPIPQLPQPPAPASAIAEALPARLLQFDAGPGGIDRTIIRTFDGMLSDLVKICLNPLPPQASLSPEALQSSMLPRPLSENRCIRPPGLAFTLLVFDKPGAKGAGDARQPREARENGKQGFCTMAHSPAEAGSPGGNPVPAAAGAREQALQAPAGGQSPGGTAQCPPPAAFPDVQRAWRMPRSRPIDLHVPSAAIPVSGRAEDAITPPAKSNGRKRHGSHPPARKGSAPPRPRERKKRRRRTLPAEDSPSRRNGGAHRAKPAPEPAMVLPGGIARRRTGGRRRRGMQAEIRNWRGAGSRHKPVREAGLQREAPKWGRKQRHRGKASLHGHCGRAESGRKPAARSSRGALSRALIAGRRARRSIGKAELLRLIGLFRKRKVTGRSAAGSSG